MNACGMFLCRYPPCHVDIRERQSRESDSPFPFAPRKPKSLGRFFTQGAWIYRGYTQADRTFPQETRTLHFLGQCMLVFHC